MGSIDISGMEPVEKLFHNEGIDTYPTELKFEEIHHWPENLRTILAFNVLESEEDQRLEDIPLEKITSFLVSRPELKLRALAKSIEKNGVRVPLIVLDDGTLLDGNRRYFACSYNYRKRCGRELLPVFKLKDKIPVWIIKKEDVNDYQINKILAGANFVSEYKVPWTLDVKAKVISEYFKKACNENGDNENQAYSEIEDVYGLKKNTVLEYVESVELAQEFIDTSHGDKEKDFKLREIVLKKFVYFWEFRNKAYMGRGKLDEEGLKEVKPLFFKMIKNSCFQNMKQVEPMIRAYHDKDSWEMLSNSGGTKIAQVDIIFREKKAIKSAADKVRNFSKWLDKLKEEKLTAATLRLLQELAKKIDALEEVK